MLGRACMLSVVAAAALVQCLPELPRHGASIAWSLGLPLLAAAVWRIRRWPAAVMAGKAWRGLCVLGCFLLACGWVLWHTQARLDDALWEDNDDKVSRVVLRVAELPRETPDSRRFVAEVLSSRVQGVPRRIEVAWHGAGYAGPYGNNGRHNSTHNSTHNSQYRGQHHGSSAMFPDIVPGQVWRMALNLRRVSGAHNPQGFDYEGHQFARGIRAQGSVRGTPELLHESDVDSLGTLAERLRHRVRQAMRPYLQDMPYAGVLLALTIGDQASIPGEQWDLFNRAGLGHLIVISGSHITMIAALGGWLANRAWRRLAWRGRPLAERLPAQIAACAAALLVAWAYCLLAGWGVPARRTFLMLSVVAVAYAARLPVSAPRLLCLAAALVVLMDPWALMASGFWLSFGAVAVLFSLGSGGGRALAVTPGAGPAKPTSGSGSATPARHMSGRFSRQGASDFAGETMRRAWSICRQAARLQLAISLALLPLLALWFNQLSLVSPLANAYAIPVIGMVVTPLALLLALASLMPGAAWLCAGLAWAAHGLLALIMPWTTGLADLPWAVVDAASAPMPWLVLAMAGLAVALLPRGWPLRHWGWLAMLPALCWRPPPLPPGEWRMTALDVGQGGAWVVQTATQVLVFDTGPRHGPTSDAGSRVLVPYLRASGINRVDALVVSHADMDHVGGARSLLAAMPTRRSYASFELAGFLQREAPRLGETEVPTLPLRRLRCEQGESWQVDGVSFRFLWPLQGAARRFDGGGTKERNANSCVLWVRGAHHAALLPGDIGAPEEARLVSLGLAPKVDVMMAAHHGSRHSSSAAWAAATRPALVVAQAGRWNRYGHPHADAVRRWRRAGGKFADTSEHGAIVMHSTPAGLYWAGQRALRKRYWHGS